MSEFRVKMPAVFVGHGSPMNAIEDNLYTRGFRSFSETLEKPKSILCISAHWETYGVQVTGNDHPPTIHDFYGFPKELYQVQYPASGNPLLADLVKSSIDESDLQVSNSWGLDHGTWSVLKHVFPAADVPVVQLSLNKRWSPMEHYCFAKQLKFLQDQGVLIVGSGNIVHNLGRLDWGLTTSGFDWAVEANEKVKQLVVAGDIKGLANLSGLGSYFKMAVPTMEHFLPLLYILALRTDDSPITFFNDSLTLGSLSMTSFSVD